MATTSFSYEDEDYTISVSTTDVDWPSIVCHFIHFLKGCGFIFTKEEIVEYMGEQMTQNMEACEDDRE